MTEPKPKTIATLVRRPLLVAALAASAVVPAPALAAYDLFLKLDGVEGESTYKGHEKWIHLFSYSTGFDNAGSVGKGGAAAGKATCSPFYATKSVDKSSPPLVAAVMSGQRFQKAQIDVVRTGEFNATFLKYELSDVIVSSLQEAGAGGGADVPQESVAMNFAKLNLTYYTQNSDGKLGAAASAATNCGN